MLPLLSIPPSPSAADRGEEEEAAGRIIIISVPVCGDVARCQPRADGGQSFIHSEPTDAASRVYGCKPDVPLVPAGRAPLKRPQ